MKKITKILLSPIFVNAKEKVEITNIEEIEKKGEVIVLAETTYEGLTINYNISFNNLNYSIKYKVTIKNNDTEEYKISNETIFSESGYISYSFSNEREFCNYSLDEETNKRTKHYYKYKKGMTWKNWNNSSYFNQSADIGSFIPQNIIECEDEVESHYDFDNITQDDWNNYIDELGQCEKVDSSGSDINEKIKDKSEGCYVWHIV